MKANEAPEKIYIFDYNDAMVTQIEGDTVYVREDVFIEKAAEYLNNFYNEETHSYLIDEDIDKFINYMKKE